MRCATRCLELVPALVLAASLAALGAKAEEPPASAPGPASPADTGKVRPRQRKAKKAVKVSAAEAARQRSRQSKYLQRNWGVDIVGVRRVSSGWMIRFDYRVVDPGRAAVLSSRNVKPYLIDEATQTALAVPAMENIGELRQTAPLQQNRTYFIIFGNPNGLVKRGGRVTLVVGNFRVEGLEVG